MQWQDIIFEELVTMPDLGKMGQSFIPMNQDKVMTLICSFSDNEFESFEFTKKHSVCTCARQNALYKIFKKQIDLQVNLSYLLS